MRSTSRDIETTSPRHRTAGIGALLLCLSALPALSGCKTAADLSGTYNGSLWIRGQTQITQAAVSMKVTSSGATAAELAVTAQPAATPEADLKITQLSETGLTLALPAPWSTSVDLKNQDGCYVQNQNPVVTLCDQGDKFFLEIADENGRPQFVLSGDKKAAPGSMAPEPPRTLTLSEALSQALAKNFDSRIEYEQVIQAKQSAQAAYLNLLPHLSLSTIAANLTPSLASLLGSVGDLAPFLLPNRWLQARAATHLAEAQTDAMELMSADLADQVEGLTYALAANENILELYAALIDRTTAALTLVTTLENTNQMPAGSTITMQEIVDWMKLDVLGFQQLTAETKQALALALGFRNPLAVEDVTLGAETTTIAAAKTLNPDPLAQIALGDAIELRQVDHLIQAAVDLKDALFFSWLDPAGDPTTELGLSLGANVAVAKSQVSALQLQREKLQAVIGQKIAQSVTDWNAAVAAYPLLDQTMALQNQRLDFVFAELTPGSTVNTLDLEGVIQDYLATGIRMANLVSSFRVARSVADRLELRGPYLESKLNSAGGLKTN